MTGMHAMARCAIRGRIYRAHIRAALPGFLASRCKIYPTWWLRGFVHEEFRIMTSGEQHIVLTGGEGAAAPRDCATSSARPDCFISGIFYERHRLYSDKSVFSHTPRCNLHRDHPGSEFSSVRETRSSNVTMSVLSFVSSPYPPISSIPFVCAYPMYLSQSTWANHPIYVLTRYF